MDPVQEETLALLRRWSGREGIRLDMRLGDLTEAVADSLDHTELLLDFEESFDLSIPDTAFALIPATPEELLAWRVADLIALVRRFAIEP